ncbi:nicotinamide riboside transporter PnuC [candidate division CSSED10-310 bacterium]|uniref:Nicotinamide riboside transporter PnuC n=1 Tax=candidate division CSSED10-310 bacterium TaxID=2855610 RepID=A0ABV6YZZ3_UNCC1
MIFEVGNTIIAFFSVKTIAFTFIGYPMSYIEFCGTLLYLWSVWLMAKSRILTWPVGIVSVLLYLAIFYQIRLYSDAFEQIYYLAASAYGWWKWAQASRSDDEKSLPVTFSSSRIIVCAACGTLVFSVVLGNFVSQLHILLPSLIPEKASYPYLDALTTVMSFTAMFLMAFKRTESWLYWIIVDVIGIWLYYVKEVKFIALLYVILLVMASNGLVMWIKESQKSAAPQNRSG